MTTRRCEGTRGGRRCKSYAVKRVDGHGYCIRCAGRGAAEHRTLTRTEHARAQHQARKERER
ncbi:hypothetical protein [Corallococcus sp. EGB]|uniref:hypothetical protein n=1 Tax=Corallococcus sp. EGB TaxID=1521117 RepID=UPI001CBC257D|nr:hypothetical protein [Corallococcus sp. EGB]